MNNQSPPPIYRRPLTDDVPESRFEGDLYERDKLASQLTAFLSMLPDGAVLALDSPWGDGKTWFAKRWQASLNDGGYRTGYIDCFQRDYLDDPFAMIAGELVEIAKSGDSRVRDSLLQAGKKLGVALLPAAAKFAVNTAGHFALGKADLAGDIKKAAESFETSTAASLEKLVEARLKAFESDGKTVAAFKKSLAQLAAEAQDGKPIVIFLDELDRCRPDFAVRTIERLKHFFDAPKVIFVLMLNRRQMAAAIEGMYGPKVDANAYLAKFIQLFLTLPKRLTLETSRPDDNRRHCRETMKRFGFNDGAPQQDFATALGAFATLLGMSLRDVERAVVLYSFAHPVPEGQDMYVAWPIALKLTRPDLFASLSENKERAHADAATMLTDYIHQAPDIDWVTKLLKVVHELGVSGFSASPTPEQAHILQSGGAHRAPKRWLMSLFNRIDLTVSP